MKRNLISAIVFSAALFSMPAAQAQDLPAMQWTSHEANYLTDVAPVFCQLPAQFLNTWQTQKNLYTPFATYSLTPEQQAAYLLLIKKSGLGFMMTWRHGRSMMKWPKLSA